MNGIIFWTVFSAFTAGFLVTCIIEAVSTAIKKSKYGKRITIKPNPNNYGWIIFFGILQGMNAGLAVYSLKNCRFTESILNRIKIVCYLLIICFCILAYFLRTRAYITEEGIISNTSFFPVKSVKYSVETVENEIKIKLYTKRKNYDYMYYAKDKEVVSMLEKLYDEFDGNAPSVKFKSGAIKYLLTLLCTSLIFFVGIFAWYEIQKPFIFVKDTIVPTNTEWAMFCDAGYFDLMFTDTVDYYDDLNGKSQEMWDNRYDLQNLTPKDIIILKELPNLKHLDVIASDIDDLTTIGELTQLEGLAVGGGKMFAKPTDYSPLKNLTKLKYFMGYGLYNFNDMTVLENADNLAHLELTYADIQTGFDVIREKENLLVLELYSCTAEDFSPIGNCSKLKRLSLNKTNVDDLSFLENLKELEYLNINDVKAEDYSVLLELPKLNTLYAQNTDIPNYIVNKLAAKGVDVQK